MLAELLDRRDAYIKYAVESVVGPVPQLINKWVTHLRHIGKHDQTDTSVSFFAHNYRDLMGTELSTQVQSRFRRAELQDMRLVYSQYFKLLAITFPKGFGAAPSASWDKLIVESWENAVYAAVPKEMISTTLMLSLNYVVFHGHCAPPGPHPLCFLASASTLWWRKARGGRRDHLVPASPPRSPPMGRGRAQAGGALGCRTACALRRKRFSHLHHL